MTEVRRSPLLPIRHEEAFFLCDLGDVAPKTDQAGMEHPLFSLSKKADMTLQRYENGTSWIEIRPSFKGRATVFDRDILIYCISQLIAAHNVGRPLSRIVRLKAYDLLVATNRAVGGHNYQLLKDAFERLQGTQIITNITTGGKEAHEGFSLLGRFRLVRETDDRFSRMAEVEVELSEWIFRAVEAKEVLTLDRGYFLLAKPLERRLYELARKHCGPQPRWEISLDKLQLKTGSQSTSHEFKRMLQTIIEADAEHNHLPGYSFEIVDKKLVVRPKVEVEEVPLVFGS